MAMFNSLLTTRKSKLKDFRFVKKPTLNAICSTLAASNEVMFGFVGKRVSRAIFSACPIFDLGRQ